jgi:hypothetical protein
LKSGLSLAGRPLPSTSCGIDAAVDPQELCLSFVPLIAEPITMFMYGRRRSHAGPEIAGVMKPRFSTISSSDCRLVASSSRVTAEVGWWSGSNGSAWVRSVQ